MTQKSGEAPALRYLLSVDESLRAQSFFLTLARVLKTLLGIAVPVVVVRALDQSTFGHYKQVGLLCGTALGVLTLALPESLHYFVARHPRSSQSLLLRTALLLTGIGLLGGGVIALTSPGLERFFSAPLGSYRVLLALIVATSLPASLLEVVGVVDRRARLSALAIAGMEALRSALVVAAALLTGDLFMVLGAVGAGLGVQCLAVAAYLLWRPRESVSNEERVSTRAQLGYALPLFGAALIGLGRDQLHSYFVAIQYTADQFAIYAVGTLAIPFLGNLTQSVADVVIIDSSRNYAAGHLEEVRRVWWRATGTLALLLLPLFATLEVFAGDVIAFVFGAEYRSAAPVFRIFLLLIPLSIPLSSAMLRASASLRTMAVADATSLVATIATLVATAGALGPLGAVASLVVGKAVFDVIAAWRIADQSQMSLSAFLPWTRLAGILLISALGAAVAGLLSASWPLWLRALAGPALGLALCGLALWMLRLVPDTERELLRHQLAVSLARMPWPGRRGDIGR